MRLLRQRKVNALGVLSHFAFSVAQFQQQAVLQTTKCKIFTFKAKDLFWKANKKGQQTIFSCIFATNVFWENDMKTKELIYNLIPCVLILAVLIFSVSTISLGWFANNNEVTSGGMSILANNGDLGVDISFFNVANNGVVTTPSVVGGVATTQKTITFNDSEQTTMPVLPLYDIMDETTHYILLKFTSSNAFTLTISTQTNYVLDSSKPLLGGNGRGESYCNWLSSVIFFQDVTFDENSFSATLPDNLFTFVDKSNYQMKVENNSLSVHCEANSAIYFVVGYDSALINRLFSQNIGNKIIEGLYESGVSFVSDCTFRVVFADEREGVL